LIQPERIRTLNKEDQKAGSFVLYWMQASVRSQYNHALEYAVRRANSVKKPLLVYFGLTSTFPEANRRHYYFLIEGLKETSTFLKDRGIKMVVINQKPLEGVMELAEDAFMVVTDRGYLPLQRKWRQKVAETIECPFFQVESDVVVPIETVSPKEEYTAGTIRRKIQKHLNDFMIPLNQATIHKNSLNFEFESLPIDNVEKTLDIISVDESVREVTHLQGGTSNAEKHLNEFLKMKLEHFASLRNDPTVDYSSQMSPYLHFGQISPLYLALMVQKMGGPGSEEYLEELIIRRELSMNFVFYDPDYDNFNCLPDWAKKTLLEHAKDPREYSYSLEELENAKTHDPYWNAAQNEMVYFGKMHGYMRMYWGKKILEWTENPIIAYSTALYLNNKYEIDGRDPNGFTGVAWCFGKHDRAWKEREIFGKVRYMNDKGLRRKFKIDHYVEKIDEMVKTMD
jgi:deoxyribodipyrimidine photo-lyase